MTETRTPLSVACPTCAAQVAWSAASPYRPFCSERCKLIDLGAWAAEEHAIPGNALESELLSDEPDGYRH